MKTVNELRKFRQQCERDAGTESSRIQVPLLHALADICQVLKLTPQQQRRVLGRNGAQKLTDVQKWRVGLVPPKPSRNK